MARSAFRTKPARDGLHDHKQLRLMLFGPLDFALMIPGLVLGLYAQSKLTSTYRRYAGEPVESGLSGAEAARIILDRAGLRDVKVEPVPGRLTDHYDPNQRGLFLSEEIYHGRSIAALGVAAHEAGHALQHQAAYAPLQLRMLMVPATNFATKAVFFIMGLGLMLTMIGIVSPALFAAILPYGIGAYAVITVFHMITLPVEFDASRRARERLAQLGLIRGHEQDSVRRVLNAAALTYVAALVASLSELLRWVLISRGLNSDRD